MRSQDQALCVLVVRGDDASDSALCTALHDRGFVTVVAQTSSQALQVQRSTAVDVAIVWLDAYAEEPTDDRPGGAPTSLVKQLKRTNPGVIIIGMLDGQVSLSRCCAAVLEGVDSFVDMRRPDLVDAVIGRIEHGERVRRSRPESTRPQGETHVEEAFRIVGSSRSMTRVLSLAKRAAAVSDAPVLINGETGTGKQLLAEAMHRMDPKRAEKPFVPVNCASITGTLAESELFGHVRGAFTGADSERLGYFRAADGGTLLLDEIGELDMSLQPKLLRALQEGRILPVGADTEVAVDVRVIAATNRSLPAMVEAGTFRMDLYQRLNVIEVSLPALRERREDIPLLVQFFLKKYASYYAHEITDVDPRVIEVLQRADLPGNVRAVENTVRRVLAFKTSGTRIELTDLPESFLREISGKRDADQTIPAVLNAAFARRLASGRMNLADMLSSAEHQILEAVLDQADTATQTQLAHELGITRRTLYSKLKHHHLSLKS